MKKYIKPEISVTVIMGSKLLAGSGLGGSPKTPGMTRYSNSIWEDDEDDWLEE